MTVMITTKNTLIQQNDMMSTIETTAVTTTVATAMTRTEATVVMMTVATVMMMQPMTKAISYNKARSATISLQSVAVQW